MVEHRTISQRVSRRQDTGRYVPRVFSQDSWWRFDQARRKRYLEELGGEPTTRQVGLIDVLISSEWDWRCFEAEADAAEGRQADEKRRMAAECRRQYLLADKEYAKTIRVHPAPPPGPPSLADIMRTE